MRREALKAYIISLLAEGQLSGLRSPSAIASKICSIFAADVPSVMSEMALMFLEQNEDRLKGEAGKFFLRKLNDLAQQVKTRGIKAVWGEIKAQYDRGATNIRGER